MAADDILNDLLYGPDGKQAQAARQNEQGQAVLDWLGSHLTDPDWQRGMSDPGFELGTLVNRALQGSGLDRANNAATQLVTDPLGVMTRGAESVMGDIKNWATNGPGYDPAARRDALSQVLPGPLLNIIAGRDSAGEQAKATAAAIAAQAKLAAAQAEKIQQSKDAIPPALARLIGDSARMGGDSGGAAPEDIFVSRGDVGGGEDGSHFARGDGTTDANGLDGGSFSHSSGKGFASEDSALAQKFMAAGISPQQAMLLGMEAKVDPKKAMELGVGAAKNGRDEILKLMQIFDPGHARDPISELRTLIAALKQRNMGDDDIKRILAPYADQIAKLSQPSK